MSFCSFSLKLDYQIALDFPVYTYLRKHWIQLNFTKNPSMLKLIEKKLNLRNKM